jgi:hypothetical protein
MGLTELVGNLRSLWQAYRRLQRALREERPDLLILIDFPEFNLRLARLAKTLRVPVLYYIAPQVWAWRQRRIRKISRSVDQMAVVLPFEVPLYEREGVRVHFVGHPLRCGACHSVKGGHTDPAWVGAIQEDRCPSPGESQTRDRLSSSHDAGSGGSPKPADGGAVYSGPCQHH